MHGNKHPSINAEITPRLYDGSYSELSAPRTLKCNEMIVNIIVHLLFDRIFVTNRSNETSLTSDGMPTTNAPPTIPNKQLRKPNYIC